MREANRISSRLLSTIRLARRRIAVSAVCDGALVGGLLSATLTLPVLLIPPLESLQPLLPWVTFGIFGVCVGYNLLRDRNDLMIAQTLDRLNQTHDLLSTALVTTQATAQQADPWKSTICNLAEDACASMRLPGWSGKYPARLHAAAWSGMFGAVLLASLARVPVSAMESSPNRTRINEAARSSAHAPDRPAMTQEDASVSRGSNELQNEPLSDTGTATESIKEGKSGAGGTGRSDVTEQSKFEPANPKSPPQTPTANNKSATGGRGAANEIIRKTGSEGGVTDAETITRRAPWKLGEWQSSRDRAEQMIRSGQLPGEYHEMITDYFDR